MRAPSGRPKVKIFIYLNKVPHSCEETGSTGAVLGAETRCMLLDSLELSMVLKRRKKTLCWRPSEPTSPVIFTVWSRKTRTHRVSWDQACDAEKYLSLFSCANVEAMEDLHQTFSVLSVSCFSGNHKDWRYSGPLYTYGQVLFAATEQSQD